MKKRILMVVIILCAFWGFWVSADDDGRCPNCGEMIDEMCVVACGAYSK